MIVLGPLLLILSGVLIGVSTRNEWVTILDEDDFRYESWEEGYSASASASDVDDKVRVTIEERSGRSVRIELWVENFWEGEIFRRSGDTPVTFTIDIDGGGFLDDYEFIIQVEDDEYDFNDLEVTVENYGIGSSFALSCLGASLIALLGICLLVLGIIFTVVYSSKIRKLDPDYIRTEMIRKQEMNMREEQAKKAMEMERIRQRQGMLMRARNLEASYRLDEAAFMYDRLDMFEDAGRCRRKKREEVSRHIHVNANDLFDKLQKRGTAIPYLCPQCHGMVDIDGENNRHTKCPYCGAMVDFETLRKTAGDLLR